MLSTLAASGTEGLLAAGESEAPALTGGYHLAFTVAAALLVVAFVVAATVLRPPQKQRQEALEPAFSEALSFHLNHFFPPPPHPPPPPPIHPFPSRSGRRRPPAKSLAPRR